MRKEGPKQNCSTSTGLAPLPSSRYTDGAGSEVVLRGREVEGKSRVDDAVSVDVSQVFLFDNSTRKLVEAELLDKIAEKNLLDWEDQWIPARDEVNRRLRTAGIDRSKWPQTGHWSWRDKQCGIQGSLSNPNFCVVCANETQGLMILDTLQDGRLQSQLGKAIVYIDYLEVAPWNRRHLPDDIPRYSAVGSILMRAAIEVSIHEGFKGRVGLHSLPQSNDWYANKCGMTDLGPDPTKQNLRYFEMTPEIAQAFINK